jgi:hypothetical protein
VERNEDEREWSNDALKDVINRLRTAENIMEIQSDYTFNPVNPFETLNAIKLEEIQKRENHRLKRNIVNSSYKNKPAIVTMMMIKM